MSNGNDKEVKQEYEPKELNNDEIYHEAIDTWGADMQIDMFIEEASELIQALIKYKRGKGDLNNIAEEIADVSIMLEQMDMVFNCHNQSVSYKKFKLARLKNTLNGLKVGEAHEEQFG
jgi:hypothetical protein